MSNDVVFSWAENAEGRMVHIDDVPRGLSCNCICPNCHERLMARHGDVKQHGFAHHSDNRGANLKICSMVILYKLAEQIVQTRKRVHVPSYYEIFPEKDVEFIDVKIDNSFERADKQPDIIATTADGKQYLIEFTFEYKVQRKRAINYKNLNCLEIDISQQTLESIENFLLTDNSNRRWLNNQDYFNNIESRYREEANKVVTLKDEEKECKNCILKSSCSGVMLEDLSWYLVIENSGHKYRLCESELYKMNMDIHQQKLKKKQEEAAKQEERRKTIIEQQEIRVKENLNARPLDSSERTCFMCQSNLEWMNRKKIGYANCGCYPTMGVSKYTPPETAKTCRGFKPKN